MMNSIHSWFSERSEHYKNWHSKTYSSAVHLGGLTVVAVITGFFMTTAIYSMYIPNLYAAALPNLMVMAGDHIPNFSQDASKTTVTATKTGLWSDPTVWSSGALPNSSQIVVIPSGKSITYDSTSGTAYTVFIQGELKYRTDINTKLTVTNLQVDTMGYLEIGTVSSPINSNVTAELVIADTPIDSNLDPEQWGTGFLSFGKVRIVGATKDPTFVKVATEPLAGQSSITLSQSPSGWKVGDRIFIPDTRYYRQNEVDGDFYPTNPQWEEFTIQSISGSTITLNRALTYNHKGARDGNGNLDFLPHVGNLTRNVVIKSASPSGTRGHMAMMHAADVDIRYATFRDMGRTTHDPLANGTNQKGRYALHMHHTYGPVPTPSNGYQFTLIGNAVDGGSSVHKFKWGITVHDSHYGLIKDNVVYNYPGAGIMTEDGNETMNVFDHNFVVRTDGVPYMRGGERGTEFGFEGAGIWLRGPNNILKNNVVANFRRWGVAYFHEYLGNVKLPNFKGADTSMAGQYTSVSGYSLVIPEFSNNEIYGSGRMGFTYWWLGSEYRTPRANGTSIIKDLKIWNVSDNGVWQYPSSKVTFDGLIIRGSAGPGTSCCGIGFNGGDYFGNDITIKNSDIQGMTTGIVPTTDAKGTQLIENTVLRNQTNIYVGTMWTSQCSATQILPRLTLVKNVKFSAPTGYPLKAITMAFSATPVRNIIQKDELYVTDYNQLPGNNFRVFYNEADANAIVPQGYYSLQYGSNCVSLVSTPVGGLTNTQSFAQYGYAVGGAPATCSDKTTRPEISGITCPFTSIPSAPLSSVPNPTGLVGGPITTTSTTTNNTNQTATLSFSASPSSVTSGGAVNLTWSSTVATTCTASNGWSGTKTTSGTATVNPTTTTTYTLNCGGTNIISANQSVTVNVTANPAPSLTLSASPTSITSGGSSTITWSTSNVSSCTASGSWTGTKATSGNATVNPTSNSTYTLDCTGTNGSIVSKSVSVSVTPLSATLNISASPTTIGSGGSATLVWTSTNTSTCTASGAWSGTKSVSGITTVSPTATSTYTITCGGTNVNPISSSATVNVIPPAVTSPTVSFSALPSSITVGQSTTLTWTTNSVSSCAASGAWSGAKSVSGSITVSPTVTSTYTLLCIGNNGSQVSQNVTVSVSSAPVIPVATVTISASPISITSGGSSTITWSTTDATTCTASNGWSGTKTISGSLSVSPTTSTTYTLTCTGGNATPVSQSVTISVSSAQAQNQTLSPTVSLAISSNSLSAPGNVVLSWSTTNATSCTASGDWSGATSQSGMQVIYVNKTSTFILNCVSSSMTSASQSVTVTLPTVNSNTTSGTGGTSGGGATGGATSGGSNTGGTTSSGGTVTIPIQTEIPNVNIPLISFSAFPLTINYGQGVTLSWQVTGANSASISGVGDVPLVGTRTLYPKINTTYVITAQGSGGFTSKSISIGVTLPPSSIAHWKMNSESGTSAYDSSRYGFTGILLNGVTWSVGYLGGSAKFDGVNDYITFGNKSSFNIVGDLSITAWINHRTQIGTDTIISKGPCNNVSCPFSLRITSTGALCFIHNNGLKGQESICTTTAVPTNTWNHVAVVRSGNQVALYLNGVLKKTAKTSRSGKSNNASLTIGGIGGAPSFSFDGRIDDVRLFNKAITLSEIKQYMTEK